MKRVSTYALDIPLPMHSFSASARYLARPHLLTRF